MAIFGKLRRKKVIPLEQPVGKDQTEDIPPNTTVAEQPRSMLPAPLSEKQEQPKPLQSQSTPRSRQPNGHPTDGAEVPGNNGFNIVAKPMEMPVDDEYTQALLDAHNMVKELAKAQMRPIDGSLGIADVLKNLNEAPSSRKDKVWNGFQHVLGAIQKIGGAAASVASKVFAPAADCYNVVNFVIDTFKGYQGAFDALDNLFDQCADYLTRLDYYEGRMDKNLSNLCAQLLKLFVQVCKRALDLKGSIGGKLKLFGRVMFLNDNGISSLLNEMDKLTNKEKLLVLAQTFKNAHDGYRATMRVEGLVSERHALDMEVNREKVIIKALALACEPTPTWRSRYRELLNQRLPDTGQWIMTEPVFTNWENGQSQANILAIEGGSGSGKSFLASAIIHHLHRKSAKETGHRVSTAYYFFEGTGRQAVKNAMNLETPAKSIVWQFTQMERLYKKSVARIYLHEMNVQFYIVIDGLTGEMGEGMLRFLRRASALQPGRRVLILLTVDAQCSQHLANIEGISFDSIPISPKNRPDVETLIRWRMDSMPAFRDATRPQTSQLRKKVCDELYQATEGDYFKINLALDDISKREYKSEIEHALTNARKGRTTQVRNEIEVLNKHCSETEILEINEIILWIQRYREPLTVKAMTAALYAKVGELSLLTLPDKIKYKYTLFKITKGEVQFRADEVGDTIPMKCRSQSKAEEAEDEQLQSAGAETYNKLEIDRFFEQEKQIRDKELIYKDDPNTEEAKMALSCLRLLAEGVDQQSDLVSYARSNLVEHLSAVNLSLVQVDYKTTFGPYLVSLFSVDSSIDTLLNNNGLSGPSPDERRRVRQLLLNDASMDIILQWLNDEAVILNVNDEARGWITGPVRTEGHRALLMPAAMRMARHLVHEPHFVPFIKHAFEFLAGFLDKYENPSEQEKLESISRIVSVERWCEKVLKGPKNALWHTQIGILLSSHGHKELAEARARQALALNGADWQASTLLAEVVGGSQGIETLKPAIERLVSSGEWKQSALERVGLAKMLFITAELSWKEGQADMAIRYWSRAVDTDLTDIVRVIRCLESYAQGKRWVELIAILRKIDEGSTEQQGLSDLIAARRFPHDMFLQAALHTRELAFAVGAYERSVQLVEERGGHATLSLLRYRFGRTIKAQQDGLSRAIKQWRQALDGADPSDMSTLISCIAPNYVQKAIAAGPNHEAVSAYLEKIEALLPEDVPEAEVSLPPRVYIARYYKKQGNPTEAKRIARNVVQLSLEILSDDDEGNDLPAYNQLLSIFIAFGDIKNILATRALVALHFMEQKIACDGDCNRVMDITEEIQWCQDCILVHLDEECRRKLEQNRLPYSTCNASHDLLRIPRMEESLGNLPEDSVPFGDDWVSFTDWLGHIEKDYVSFE
ncbi:hypothetical protein BO85DRAFT_398810 [Aspergillus piperis CBS 112811]|uniref:Fungal STAND N-terminal Goodbye domain-containing protein n=1 Tax=Aspergillus piperis CBS 112811 TaxID=1448313 RepID=A0A8G1QZW7_9EURO|nr:hypothetical protein BO85DRAFT_398810 [Aspergillus piperis CBS 112811]RAH56627.1 hypothetical protein BO85DRAFT_398810 [Aspergillus piperis CBS 112811]